MIGGTRFYERAEIKDVISYLKFIYNPLDTQAFLRCIGSPKRGIGKTSLDHLLEYAEKQNIGPLEACLQSHQIPALAGKASKGLAEFGVLAERWHNMASLMPVKDLLELVLTQSGFLKKLKEDAAEAKDELAAGRVENVEELLAVAEEFEQIADEPTLEAFLTRISLVSDLDALKAGEDAVKLMTLHSAKGLEFENVFLIGLEDGLFPHKRTLDSPKELEEERRLMYVGVTRAGERLYLTYARKRASYMSGGNGGFSNYTIPSRFLNEIDSENLMGLEALPDIKDLESGYGRSEGRSGYGRGGGDWQENRYGRGGGGDDWQENRYRRGGGDSQENRYGRGADWQENRYGRGAGTGGGRDRYGSSSSSQGYGQPAARSPYRSDSGAQSRPGATPPQSKPRVLSRTGPQSADSRNNTPAPPSNTFNSTGSTASAASDFERLKVGEKVMHTKFGVGTVAEIIGDGDKELYAVKFESAGKRILDPRFARLVKLT
jgi:DNA helicase-2/ATP-dependent DNA helicase PcrA